MPIVHQDHGFDLNIKPEDPEPPKVHVTGTGGRGSAAAETEGRQRTAQGAYRRNTGQTLLPPAEAGYLGSRQGRLQINRAGAVYAARRMEPHRRHLYRHHGPGARVLQGGVRLRASREDRQVFPERLPVPGREGTCQRGAGHQPIPRGAAKEELITPLSAVGRGVTGGRSTALGFVG